MADLLDRIRGSDGPVTAPEDRKIPLHEFVAGTGELVREVSGVTLQTLVTHWSLTTQQETQLVAFLTRYAAGDFDRDKLKDVLYLCERRLYSKAKTASELGF